MKLIKVSERMPPDSNKEYFGKTNHNRIDIFSWDNMMQFYRPYIHEGDEMTEWLDETIVDANIPELRAENSGLRYAISELEERINRLTAINNAHAELIEGNYKPRVEKLSKDLKETREQLRISICWENFSNWIKNNYETDEEYVNHFREKDRRGQAFSRGIDWAELKKRYSQLNNLP
jgi:hypothetical protein